MERISHGVMVHSEILASVAAVIRAAEPFLVEPLHRNRQRRLFNPVRFRWIRGRVGGKAPSGARAKPEAAALKQRWSVEPE